MASSDIRKFYFYQQYLWQPTDFENLQQWIFDEINGIAEGAHGAAILSGLNVVPAGGLNVQIPAGIAVNSSGRLLVNPSADQLGVVADGSNPVRHLIVIRPLNTDTTLIDDPINPLTQVPLHQQLGFELVVIPGTPAATPQYPSAAADDVILMGIKVAAGQVTLTQADMDRKVMSLRRKRTFPINSIASTQTLSDTDDIIEVTASGGSVTAVLPTASTVPGKEYKVIKVDSSANQVAVSGQGGEQISGQNSQVIDDQWGFLRVYSNGNSWRVF